MIASDADASKNNLSTGTLTFSDIQNQSSYDAHSGGFSAGVTTGDGGANYSTHGPGSTANGQARRTVGERQMRIMGVSVDGTSEPGAPDTLVGQMPTDSGARWISGGTTSDGKPILTQVTAQTDPQLQSYILSNYNSASPGQVPSPFQYDRPTGSDWVFSVTGPFTKFDQSDAVFMRNTTADTASMISNTAGWISSTAATGVAASSPYAPALGTIAFGSTVTGIAADAISQLVKPNVGQYAYEGAVALGAQVVADRVPLASLVINGTANVKTQPFSTTVENWISQQWGSIVIPNASGTKK